MNMHIFVESGIEFDFSHAVYSERHDSSTGNRAFPAIDFLVEEPKGDWIWVEVKNWEPSSLPSKLRGSRRAQFLARMRSKVFFHELRDKVLGTSTYLALMGLRQPQTRILFVAVIESPRMDAAMMVHATDRLQQQFPRRPNGSMAWRIPIDVIVVSVSGWKKQFPKYNAIIL